MEHPGEGDALGAALDDVALSAQTLRGDYAALRIDAERRVAAYAEWIRSQQNELQALVAAAMAEPISNDPPAPRVAVDTAPPTPETHGDMLDTAASASVSAPLQEQSVLSGAIQPPEGRKRSPPAVYKRMGSNRKPMKVNSVDVASLRTPLAATDRTQSPRDGVDTALRAAFPDAIANTATAASMFHAFRTVFTVSRGGLGKGGAGRSEQSGQGARWSGDAAEGSPEQRQHQHAARHIRQRFRAVLKRLQHQGDDAAEEGGAMPPVYGIPVHDDAMDGVVHVALADALPPRTPQLWGTASVGVVGAHYTPPFLPETATIVLQSARTAAVLGTSPRRLPLVLHDGGSASLSRPRNHYGQRLHPKPPSAPSTSDSCGSGRQLFPVVPPPAPPPHSHSVSIRPVSRPLRPPPPT
jgi:hypothetical protein